MAEMYSVKTEEANCLRQLQFTSTVLAEMISEYFGNETLENRQTVFAAIGKLEAQLIMLDIARKVA